MGTTDPIREAKMTLRVTRPTTALLLLLVLSWTVAACSDATMRYVAQGPQRTVEEAEEFARDFDVEPWAGLSPSDTADARVTALASLREQGGEASTLADLLTDTLSAGDGSVPAYAEACTVQGADAWMVVEVWGSSGRPPEHTRLWLLTRPEGRVLAASSYR